MFLAERGILVFDNTGRIDIGATKISAVSKYQQSSDEIAACYKRAEFVGRWLALAGSPQQFSCYWGLGHDTSYP